jgi:ureidoglycolate lyase
MTDGEGRTITAEELDPDALAGCGTLLGLPPVAAAGAPSFVGPAAEFRHVHDFDPGADGTVEILWVRYRNDALVARALEAHWLTEQAVVPLGAAIVQVVCPSREDGSRLPDLDRLRAFHVPAGYGVCMDRGCWHTTFVTSGEATCLMLTRASTTRDLAAHLTEGAPAKESTIVDLAELGGPVRVVVGSSAR